MVNKARKEDNRVDRIKLIEFRTRLKTKSDRKHA